MGWRILIESTIDLLLFLCLVLLRAPPRELVYYLLVILATWLRGLLFAVGVVQRGPRGRVGGTAKMGIIDLFGGLAWLPFGHHL